MPGVADEARDRGRVDDRARLLLQHDRQHVAQAEEHALDVDADDLVEHRLVVLGDRRDLAFDAGVVEEAVDAAEGVERGLHVGPHLGRLRDIGGVGTARCPPCCWMVPGRALGAGGVPVHRHDFGAAHEQSQRSSAPDAVRCRP